VLVGAVTLAASSSSSSPLSRKKCEDGYEKNIKKEEREMEKRKETGTLTS
jgi:hypothetical protein